MTRLTKRQKEASAQPMMIPSGWMPAPTPAPTVTKIALSIDEAAESSGFSRSTLYEALAKGELRGSRRGRKVVILVEELRRWLVAMTANAEPEPPPPYRRPGPVPKVKPLNREDLNHRVTIPVRKPKP